jgi:hypothetical protein
MASIASNNSGRPSRPKQCEAPATNPACCRAPVSVAARSSSRLSHAAARFPQSAQPGFAAMGPSRCPSSLSSPARLNPHSAKHTVARPPTAISCLAAVPRPAVSARRKSLHASIRKPAHQATSTTEAVLADPTPVVVFVNFSSAFPN